MLPLQPQQQPQQFPVATTIPTTVPPTTEAPMVATIEAQRPATTVPTLIAKGYVILKGGNLVVEAVIGWLWLVIGWRLFRIIRLTRWVSRSVDDADPSLSSRL